MAARDVTDDVRRGVIHPVIDTQGVYDAMSAGADAYDDAVDATGARMSSMRSDTSTTQGGSAQFEPAEFAFNKQTGEVMLPNGEVIKATAPVIMQLATLQSEDGRPVPVMSAEMTERARKAGFRPRSQQQLRQVVEDTPTESDFWGQAFAAGKQTLGLIGSTLDSLVGNDEISNSWTSAQEDRSNTQTLGQYKASQGRWYSGWDAFMSGLGETAGNVAGNVIGALPVAAGLAGAGAVSGAGVGAIPGGVMGAAAGVSGGAAAYGEQATEFYDSALEAMQKMDPATLERESPLYREVVRSSPGITHEDAMREVAIQGARVAGATAGSLGAIEGLVGGKLAGNLLARMGFRSAVLGATQAAVKSPGLRRSAGRAIGRALAGGAGAGAEEMAESMLGQAAGAAYTGVGDSDPMAHMDIEEGIKAAQGGLIFGALGGRRHANPAEALESSGLADSLRANAGLDTAAQATANRVPADMGVLGAPVSAVNFRAADPQQTVGQLENVLADRFGENWRDNIDYILQDNQQGGRQLIGQLMAAERALSSQQVPLEAEGQDRRAAAPGDPFAAAPLQLDGAPPVAPVEQQQQQQQQQPIDPNQQDLPGMAVGPQERVATEPRGEPAPLNLRERRAAQEMRQQQAAEESAANPLPLEQRASRSIEQDIADAEDQVTQLEEQVAARAAQGRRDVRLPPLRRALKEAKANLANLEAQWQEQRLSEGPQGVVPEARVGGQLDLEPPAAAPSETTPDGRPQGVAPAPLANPEPMHPEEARQRRLTALQRREQTTAATATQQAATGQQVAQAVQSSEEQVSPSTAEPAQDIEAQLQDLTDPTAGRDAVFIADGQYGAQRAKRGVPEGAQEVYRKGVGTLITTNPTKAKRFKTGRLNDQTLQEILGYAENKADAIAAGTEPVVVQAKTKDGAVAAEQLASAEGVPAARAAVKKLARKGAKVSETTPQEMQAERAKPAKKSLKRGKEAASKPKAKKSLKKSDKDDERTTGPSEAQTEAGNYPKRHLSVDGLDISVETEAGQRRRAEWPALKNAYGYIRRTLGRDGDHVDVFLGPNADKPGNVYVIDQNKANGHFDEHKVMLGFDSADAARRAYLSNYTRGWNGLGKVTAMEWGEFKQWVRDGKLTTERTRVESSNAMTASERAAGATTEPGRQAASIADTVARGATRRADSVRVGAKEHPLADRLTTRSGRAGIGVDLTVESLNAADRDRVQRILETGRLSDVDAAKANAVLRDYAQLDTMLSAAVERAEERLMASDEAKALAEQAKADMLEAERTAAQGQKGRPRETARTSLLASLPLTASEQRGFLRTLRDEAKAELQAKVSPAQSLVRQMAGAIDSRYPAAMANERGHRQLLQALAGLTDEQLDTLAKTTGPTFYHSTVAKQVMRGATEVAHAMGRMEQDMTRAGQTASFSVSLPSWADHLAEDGRKLPHVTEHGQIPEAARGVVNTWVAQFEKGGNKFSAPVHVVDMAEAVKNYPEAFLRGVPGGKFLRLADEKGRTTGYVLAMDWGRYQTTEAAVEVLAHEYGHMVTLEMYARADPRTRAAIDKAYNGWLQSQMGRQLGDILRDQMPGYERMLFNASESPVFDGQPTYSTNFWEWSARNAALYILDPARPHLTAVEKFFSKVGAVLRSLYQSLTGAPKTEAAWSEAMDRWIAGTEQIHPMPWSPSQHFNHEEFAEGTRAPKDLRRDDTADRTAALSELKGMLQGDTSQQVVRKTVRDIWDGLSTTKAVAVAKRLGLSLMSLRQIEEKYRDTPLGRYLTPWVRLQQEKATLARTTMEAGSRWMEQANALDHVVRSALERVMYYATHFGVHPDLPITDKANAHLLEGNDRVRAVQEKRYNMVRDLYLTLQRADGRVPKIYAGLRDSFATLHRQTMERLLENVEESEISDKAKEAISKRIKAAIHEHRRGPYFPMMRFGKWIVKVALPSKQLAKDDGTGWATKAEAREKVREQQALNPGAAVVVEGNAEDGYYVRVTQRGVYYFDSEREANAARADIEKEVREHYDQHDVDFDTVAKGMEEEGDTVISKPFGARDNYEESKAVPNEFLNEVRRLIKEGKMDPEVASTLEQLAVEALPENSFRHALLPRQNIFGASKQMLRAYAHRYQGASYNFATVTHGRAINRNWEKAWKTAREFPAAERVLNVLEAGQKAIAERTKASAGNTAMSFLTDLSSLFSLGFSPAYAITNSLQPMMISAPTLAGMVNPVTGKAVGMVKSLQYLREAYKGAVPYFTKRGVHDFIAETKTMFGQRNETPTAEQTARGILNQFAKDDGERAMLESLLSRGTLDFSWLNSLEDAMRGGVLGQKWANLQRAAMAFPQQVETMNRVTTALAAYRLAKDENMTDGGGNALNDFADRVVAATQLDYSRMNRPLAFNKAGLNVALQFKLYTQGMYMLFAKQLANTLATTKNTPKLEGETDAQHVERVRQLRVSGRRTVAYLFAMHAAVGGVTGLGPIASLAQMGLAAFGLMAGDDDDDKWKSGEQLQRELLRDLFGDEAAVIADKGLPALLGLDMSDRIGIPKLVDTKFTGISERDSTATGMDKLALYAAGAPYSNVRRLVQGASDAMSGDLRSAANGLPTALRNVLRAGKWAHEGIVDRDGDTFIGRDALNWQDIGATALGLQPIKTSEAYQERSERKSTSARIMQQRVALVRAHNAGQNNASEIAEFNRSVPKQFRISGAQLVRSKSEKAKRDRGELNRQESAVKKMLGQ